MQTAISYGLAMEEMSACVAAGMDVAKWLDGGYPIRIKAHVVAWHRMKNLIEAHSNDAAMKKNKPKH